MYRDSVETSSRSPAEHKHKRSGSRCFQFEASSTSLLASYQLLKNSKTLSCDFFKVHGIMFEGISWKMKPSPPLQASQCESSSAKVTITSTHRVCVCVCVCAHAHKSWTHICMNARARPPRPHKHVSGLCLITCQLSEAQRVGNRVHFNVKHVKVIRAERSGDGWLRGGSLHRPLQIYLHGSPHFPANVWAAPSGSAAYEVFDVKHRGPLCLERESKLKSGFQDGPLLWRSASPQVNNFMRATILTAGFMILWIYDLNMIFLHWRFCCCWIIRTGPVKINRSLVLCPLLQKGFNFTLQQLSPGDFLQVKSRLPGVCVVVLFRPQHDFMSHQDCSRSRASCLPDVAALLRLRLFHHFSIMFVFQVAT